MPENNLIVFLKYPEPGKVKTRLAKTVGFEKAAEIYSILTKHILSNINYEKDYNISFYYSPKEKLNEVSRWLKTEVLFPQSGKDLGEKLSYAFDSSFQQGYQNTIIIGTDCIEITCEDINNAFNYLSMDYDSVVGPTYDGGYYLIGLSGKNYPKLFKNIEWSTDKVYKQTIEKISKTDIKNKVLDYYNDIDVISDINSKVIKIINSYNPDLRISG